VDISTTQTIFQLEQAYDEGFSPLSSGSGTKATGPGATAGASTNLTG